MSILTYWLGFLITMQVAHVFLNPYKTCCYYKKVLEAWKEILQGTR